MSVIYPHGSAARLPSATRDSSRDAAGERDLYAAWKNIFEQSRPTQFETARKPADREPAAQERIAPRAPGEGAVHDAAGDMQRVCEPMRLEAAAAPASDSEFPPLPMKARTAPAVDIEPMPQAHATIDATEAASDTALRIHFVRALSAPPDREPQPEAVSIVLEGSEVSIIVRDNGLSESDALRAAFGTARALTGRPDSLHQLTLNGRVLYQHTSRVDAPAADVLFSC